MAYKSDRAAMSKLEYAQSAAAALSYLILNQQDSVGLLLSTKNSSPLFAGRQSFAS